MNEALSPSQTAEISNPSDRHPDVQTALRDMTGHVAEALALLELYRTCQDDASFAYLAAENMRRYTDTWDRLEHLLLVHGVPPFRLLATPAEGLSAAAFDAASEDVQ